jgi:acyl-CoA hydrolase
LKKIGATSAKSEQEHQVTFFPITERVHPQAIDRGKCVFTFGMDQKAMYDYLDDSPSVASWPVDYVNDPRIIAQNDNVISIMQPLRST